MSFRVTLILNIAIQGLNTASALLASIDSDELGNDDKLAKILHKSAAAITAYMSDNDEQVNVLLDSLSH